MVAESVSATARKVMELVFEKEAGGKPIIKKTKLSEQLNLPQWNPAPHITNVGILCP